MQNDAVNRAFSKQSVTYDQHDANNPILKEMRGQVYQHLAEFLKPQSHILELNAGTGIDALHLVKLGHRVHAIDIADGMIQQLEKKILLNNLSRLTCQQLSYDALDKVTGRDYDQAFSNFGGLNCIADLSLVTTKLPAILRPGAYVTWVIMPPVCLWELLWVFKGSFKKAFRRFPEKGVKAHLEGEYFQTYYHSLPDIKRAFGGPFRFIRSEGLAALTPQPHRTDFPLRHPNLYRGLQKTDAVLRTRFPFNRWADHIIVTFQYKP